VTEIKSVHRGLGTSLSKSQRSAESRRFSRGTPRFPPTGKVDRVGSYTIRSVGGLGKRAHTVIDLSPFE
jgi:hypothetical protein